MNALPSATIAGPEQSTSDTANPPSPNLTQLDFPFLSPPMEPGEIGRLQHYRIIRKLGEGGMGMVFAAEDTHLRRPVALKVMHPRIADKLHARERFLREARAMAALTHDHVVTIYQVGNAETADGHGVSFLAMQFLEGQPLDVVLRERGKLPAGEAARIGMEIARGLAAAHARSLIHRDIKPGNVWLESPRGRVKILDFGLARCVDGSPNLSSNGAVVGTPYYMAPEQGMGEKVDARADLFSLGCALYEMLSGELPFKGESIMEVLTKLAMEEPKPVSQLVPDLPAGLPEIVQRLMAKKPDGRPASAEEAAELLAPFADGAGLAIANRPGAAPPIAMPHAETVAHAGQTVTKLEQSVVLQDRRRFLIGASVAAAGGLGYIFVRGWSKSDNPTILDNPAPAAPAKHTPSGEPIHVGILHSQTGTLRSSSASVIQMTQFAFEEINEKGGLLGRPIKYFTRDGKSDEIVSAREAERLIVQDNVDAIFGCWSSACRKSVKSVVEHHNNLLFYPLQYEGLERSPNIVYTGATPNQQLLPAVDWCLRKKPGAKFFLVGSDYIFPRSANAILGHRIEEKGGSIVGEEYLPLGETDVKDIILKIDHLDPDFILNTINGSTNTPFFSELRGAGVTSAESPTISFSVDEQILRGLPPRAVAGDYAAWNYFESIASQKNEDFVKRYRDYWGERDAITDPMEAAYLSVQLWAQAVTEAKSTSPVDVRQAILGQSIDSPEGKNVKLDSDTQHLWKYFRLGQITNEGTFKIVYEHDTPIPPVPFPKYRTPEGWELFQNTLYKGWGNRWSRPTE